jgi:hypothetical protein
VQLGGIREVLDRGSQGAALGEKLDSLGKALLRLARPQLDVRVEAPSRQEAFDVLAKQMELLERSLVPVVEAATKALAGTAEGGQMREQLAELQGTFDRLETRLRRPSMVPQQMHVTLDMDSASHFYRGLGEGDVLSDGGLFVSTYGKVPGEGSVVTLRVGFPGGRGCEVVGQVMFVQEAGEDVAPGVGVRITEITDEGKALVARYVAHRAPMLRA